jgi:4-diphosphocytidyl-2-C-methyl-D-erythritol kinase
LAQVSGRAVPSDAIRLGADVPVCLATRASRMRGIGERVEPVDGFPALDVVLVNPGAPVPTPMVFDHMSAPNNPPMPDSVPAFHDLGGCVEWLRAMRNDLEAPAIAVEPAIADVCETLDKTPGCMLTRLSGSGATCFGIYADAETAAAAAGRLHEAHPGWWVVATRLNASS